MTTPASELRSAHVYTEGVMEDGAAILRDGVPIGISEILALLNRSAALPVLLAALEKIARRAAGPMPEDEPADWLRDLRHIEADARAALAKAGGAA